MQNKNTENQTKKTPKPLSAFSAGTGKRHDSSNWVLAALRRAAEGLLGGGGERKTINAHEHVHASHPLVLQTSQREEWLRIRCRTSSVRRLPRAVLPIGKSLP